MTFGTTYGVVNQVPDVIGHMCFLHPNDMTADMQSHPQLIGWDTWSGSMLRTPC